MIVHLCCQEPSTAMTAACHLTLRRTARRRFSNNADPRASVISPIAAITTRSEPHANKRDIGPGRTIWEIINNNFRL